MGLGGFGGFSAIPSFNLPRLPSSASISGPSSGPSSGLTRSHTHLPVPTPTSSSTLGASQSLAQLALPPVPAQPPLQSQAQAQSSLQSHPSGSHGHGGRRQRTESLIGSSLREGGGASAREAREAREGRESREGRDGREGREGEPPMKRMRGEVRSFVCLFLLDFRSALSLPIRSYSIVLLAFIFSHGRDRDRELYFRGHSRTGLTLFPNL